VGTAALCSKQPSVVYSLTVVQHTMQASGQPAPAVLLLLLVVVVVVLLLVCA
jgi:hypothetical protein